MIRLLRVVGPLVLAALLRASGPEFEFNSGQANARFLYLARAGTTRAYIENRAVEFHISSQSEVRLSWAGTTSGADWSVADPTGNISYYCNQPKADLCRKPVPGYGRLVRKNLYSNIDWVLHGSEGRFEYDLIVHPGAKLEDAHLRVEGAEPRLNTDGSLRAGNILHWRPAAYQWIEGKKTEVEASLVQREGSEFGFAVGPHRADLDLTIDPVIQPVGVAGGSDDDTIIGTATGRSCSYTYGITRSADWSRLSGPGSSVFAQFIRPGYGTQNFFWGGNGDSQVGGADTDLNNCRLYLVGWTSAQNAPTFDSSYEHLFSRAYAGGATDGFFLEFAWGGLAFASYLGGPGADRIYDVRGTAASGSTGPFALVGETDNSAWPLSNVQQLGPGGHTDAFAAVLSESQLSMLIIGGSGNDRAMRLRAADRGYWTIGGETDSSDFPSTDGSQVAGGKDLWVGRIATDFSSTSVLRVFGGSGDEQFGGLASIPGRGLYVAGTTNSADLPAAVNSFHGGASDGFIAALDPLTAVPSTVTYIGGSGRDEITVMTTYGNELLLGGHTDSPDIALPGLNQNALGGLDALFVLSDALGVPALGFRFGGSADDRVFGIEPSGFGQMILAGSSKSQDWVQSLDPYAAGLGGQDGFAVSVSFADLQLTPVINQTAITGELYVGRDLRADVQVAEVSEPGMDGIILVRSTDPSRLLVSSSSNMPGTDQILITGVDNAQSGQQFTVQALSDTGDVDVIVEGRSAASPNGVYPRQVFRVRLAPTALFASSPKNLTLAVGNMATVGFFPAPVLPDGTAGPAESLRYGVTDTVGLSTSDSKGLPLSGSSSPDSYQASVKAVNPGDYTLVPSSSLFPAAPGQSVAVHVVNKIAPSVFSGKNYYLIKGTVAPLYLNGSQGDSLVFTSDDPSRLLLGSNATASAASVTVAYGSTLYLAATAGDGAVALHVTGTYRGEPVSEVAQVGLVPYKVSFSPPPPIVGVGVTINPSATLTPQPTPDLAGWNYLEGNPRAEIFGSVQLQSSNPAVLQPQKGVNVLVFPCVAVQPGTATLSFPPNAPAEFASFTSIVHVVPATLDFGASVIRVPAVGSVYLYPSSYWTATSGALQSVRLRLSTGAPAAILSLSDTGTDVIMDFTKNYSAGLLAKNAQPGQQATLFVSAPGIPEFAIPVHFVEPVFVPDSQEIRLFATNTQQIGSSVSYHLAAFDAGQVVEFGLSAQVSQNVTVYPILNPSGICTAPASVHFGGSSVPLTCAAPGVTTLTLQPGPGVSSAESQFSVRVVSQPVPVAPLPLVSRILLGNGLQSELSMYLYSPSGTSGPFIGTLTSSDPDRVRLSIDRNAPGSGSVTVPSNGTVRSVFVQGYTSDGVVTLTAQSADGRTGQVTVYLFPSTLAVRPPDPFSGSDFSAILSLNQPLSTPDFTVSVRPYLVDPGSKKLLWNSTLSIRGGSDPVFVRAQTSDATIVQPAPPDAIVSEGDTSAALKFHVNAVGDAILSATQPNGFIAVPDSSLQTHIFERGLDFGSPVVLSADLQMAVNITSPGAGGVGGVTVTSLDPEKLVLSASQSTLGQASVTVSNGYLYLQALSGVQPGDKVGVRLEAPGYVTSQSTITFGAAELQTTNTVPLSLPPVTTATLQLIYGPVDSQGRVSFNGSIRPGVNQSLQVSSSDSSILGVTQQSIPLNTNMSVSLRTLTPGHAQILVQAPPQITNRVGALDVVVGPYQFPTPQLDNLSRYLVAKCTVTNPRPQETTVTIASSGIAPARLGTAVSGAGAPSAEPLTVTLNANETRSLYLEAAGPGNTAQIQLTASDFVVQTATQSVQDPLVTFLESGPMNLSPNGGALPITVVLYGSYPKRELPLGTAYGPLNIQVQSSNPNVVSVSAASVTFNSGDSRKSIMLQPVGTGDAIVSVIVPASFAGNSPTRQDIFVNVR